MPSPFDERIEQVRQVLQKHGIVFSEAVQALGIPTTGNALATAAKSRYLESSDCDIEMDNFFVTSEGEEGTWVSAWLWVPKTSSDSTGACAS
jgi:hypothetical protein